MNYRRQSLAWVWLLLRPSDDGLDVLGNVERRGCAEVPLHDVALLVHEELFEIPLCVSPKKGLGTLIHDKLAKVSKPFSLSLFKCVGSKKNYLVRDLPSP